MRRLFAMCAPFGALLITLAPLSAQSAAGGAPGRAGPRPVLPRSTEVALARSAAPPAVSDGARVLAWNGAGFEVAEEGTNGVTCYVSRSWPTSLEPHCFDAEGSSTILPIHLRQVELWAEGRQGAEIDADIAEGLRSGRFRLPTRPSMSYMMSAGQRLVSDEGLDVGAWQPHLMIYYPWLTSEALGLGAAAGMEAGLVVDPGTPLSNIMIVVPEAVPVAEPRDRESPAPGPEGGAR
jgi:hypothetical protein